MPKRKNSTSSEEEEDSRLRLSDILGGWNPHGPDTNWDNAFVQQVIKEIDPHNKQKKAKAKETWGDRNSRMLFAILNKATLPRVSTNVNDVINDGSGSSSVPDSDKSTGKGPKVEALYLEPEDAYDYIASADFHPDVPVFVTGDVHPQLTSGNRPIETFFKWQEDLDREVCVQIPSNPRDKDSFARRSIGAVKEHFLFNNKKNNNDPEDEICKDDEPWNVLDCGNPLPNCPPSFMSHISCGLLRGIKDYALGPNSGIRIRATPFKWNQWHDILEWALLSEGGNLTSPHQDAHALDTWIQVQEGAFGFGWMSRPTFDEYDEWMDDPVKETSTRGNKWRYTVLKPGQTVFFGAGTIHYVFRIKGYQTLATGGHNMRWNDLERWIQVLTLQMKYVNACNEDLDKVKMYIPAIEYLISKRLEHNVEADVLPVGFVKNGRKPREYFEHIISLIQDPEAPWNKRKAPAPRGGKKAGKKPAKK